MEGVEVVDSSDGCWLQMSGADAHFLIDLAYKRKSLSPGAALWHVLNVWLCYSSPPDASGTLTEQQCNMDVTYTEGTKIGKVPISRSTRDMFLKMPPTHKSVAAMVTAIASTRPSPLHRTWKRDIIELFDSHQQVPPYALIRPHNDTQNVSDAGDALPLPEKPERTCNGYVFLGERHHHEHCPRTGRGKTDPLFRANRNMSLRCHAFSQKLARKAKKEVRRETLSPLTPSAGPPGEPPTAAVSLGSEERSCGIPPTTVITFMGEVTGKQARDRVSNDSALNIAELLCQMYILLTDSCVQWDGAFCRMIRLYVCRGLDIVHSRPTHWTVYHDDLMPFFDTVHARLSKNEWRMMVGIPPNAESGDINGVVLPFPSRTCMRRYRTRLLPNCASEENMNEIGFTLACSILSSVAKATEGSLYVGLRYEVCLSKATSGASSVGYMSDGANPPHVPAAGQRRRTCE